MQKLQQLVFPLRGCQTVLQASVDIFNLCLLLNKVLALQCVACKTAKPYIVQTSQTGLEIERF